MRMVPSTWGVSLCFRVLCVFLYPFCLWSHPRGWSPCKVAMGGFVCEKDVKMLILIDDGVFFGGVQLCEFWL